MDKLKQNGGYFQRFEWMPEGYDQLKEIKKEERINDKLINDRLHPEKFCVSQNKKLLKYEYPFSQENTEEKFVYGFLC